MTYGLQDSPRMAEPARRWGTYVLADSLCGI